MMKSVPCLHVHLSLLHDMTKVGQLLATPINTCCVMEALLQKELASSRVVSLGRGGGGCISNGQSYETDSGRVFVKRNSDQKATTDFDTVLYSVLVVEIL